MDQTELHRLRVADRAELVVLLKALNGAFNALRRDECGDPTIFGSRGHIRATDGKFSIFVSAHSPRAWTFAKAALANIGIVSQDGDDEGIIVMTRMPDADEAELIRRYIGLHQTREVSPDQMQKARNARQIGG